MNNSIENILSLRKPAEYMDPSKYNVQCQFCGERCLMDFGTSGTKYWKCTHHKNVEVKYLIADHPDVWYTLVLACDKDKRYFFVSQFYNNNYMTEAFRIDEIFKKGSPASYAKTIFALDFHPKDITPDNVISKMNLWIPFS